MAQLIPDDPQQRKYMAIGLVFLAAIYPFHAFWYSGQREDADATQARLETLQTQNRRAQLQAARGGSDLEERMALYERHVDALEELIPAAEEVPALVDDISQRAIEMDVELNRILPEPSETGAFYNRTSYEMAVIGEYHDVARFLTAVASLSRIVTPVELDIQTFDQPDVYPEFVSPILVTFRIETYVLPEGTQAAPAPADASSGA